MTEQNLGAAIAIDRSEAAAVESDERSQKLQVGAAAIHAVIESGHPRLLDLVGEYLGREIDPDELVSAAAEVESAATREGDIAARLRDGARQIHEHGLPA